MKNVLTFLMSLILVTSLFAGDNLLVNPGFENGVAAPWSSRGGGVSVDVVTEPKDPGSSGYYTGRSYNRTQTWNGIQQDLTGKMIAGQNYTTGCWVLTDSPTPQRIQLTFQWNNGATSYTAAGTNSNVGNSQWVFISGSFTMPQNVNSISFYVECPSSANAIIYVDDAYVGIGQYQRPAPAIESAEDPFPANGDETIDSQTTDALSWTAPDSEEIISISGYDVYFGTDSNITNNSVYSVTSETLPISLGFMTTYYWRVDSNIVVDINGTATNQTAYGEPWSFTTLAEDAKPTVTADDDFSILLNNLPATLNATVNDFGEDDITSVNWEVIDSELATITDTTNDIHSASQSAILETDTAGVYQVRITVTDSTSTCFDTVYVTVTLPANIPPAVTMGNNVLTQMQSLPVSLTAAIDDSGEDDIVSVTWTVLDDDSATISDTTNDKDSPNQSASFYTDSPGVYAVQIAVTDGIYTVKGNMLVTVVLTNWIYPKGDLNQDYIVDILDLNILASQWLESTGCTGLNCVDLDELAGVTLTDFGILAANWHEDYGLPLAINEFVASNNSPSGISDPQGEFDDWIEIHNYGQAAIDMAGMYLTDNLSNPTVWRFPFDRPEDTTIIAGGFLVVWADSNINDTPGLHADFKLSSDGEEVALYETDGTTLVDSIVFGNQLSNISYGRWPDGNTDLRYFKTPTPKAANIDTYLGFVDDTKFSHDRGFYDTPFSLTISCDTPGAQIYYSTDGSNPIVGETGTGTIYSGPIAITENVCIRAAATKTGWKPTNIDTHTYVFDANGVGGYDVNAIRSLPVYSIVGDPDTTFWGENGIFKQPEFTYRGIDYERPVSFEILDAQTGDNVQVDCGIRVAAGSWIRERYTVGDNWQCTNNKISTKLYFRSRYGDSELLYPAFPFADTEYFKAMQLRAGQNDRCDPFINDEWFRRLSKDMGSVASTGTIVNFFLNGKFKSYFNPCQRYNDDFFRDYYNVDTDWDVITHGGVRDGDNVAFEADRSFFMSRDMNDPANYALACERVDIVSLIDYLILQLYSTNFDWPYNNWVVSRERSPEGKWRFHCWDMEFMDNIYSSPGLNINYNNITSLNSDYNWIVFYNRLKNNPDFKMLWADRVQKHFFYDGALTQQNLISRWTELQMQISQVLNAKTRTLDYFIPGRTPVILQIFENQGLFPGQAPDFQINGISQHGGYANINDLLTMTNPGGNGTIYFTLDGSDPRLPGGELNTTLATAYSEPIPLTRSVVVKARIKNGSTWSALHESTYSVGPVAESLRITELMYHPEDPNYEFIEINNIGSESVNLNMTEFTEGISHVFGDITIAAGGYLVLAGDRDMFLSYYTDLPADCTVVQWGSGALSNSGERIEFLDAGGGVIQSFRFEDWYKLTDGDGFSLTLLDPTMTDLTLWDQKESWNASTYPGGSPGQADQPLAANSIVINEVMTNDISPDWIELYNTTANAINISGWYLSDSDNNLLKYQIPEGTSINQDSYLVFYADTSFGDSFHLSKNGDEVYLSSAINGVITGYYESEDFGPSRAGLSFGRYQKNDGSFNFVQMNATPELPNTEPVVGPLVISEIMYNPLDNGDAEYIEIENISAYPVGLWTTDTQSLAPVPWRLIDESGVMITFPNDMVLDAGEKLLLVKSQTDYVSEYGNIPAGVQWLAWGDAKLSNGGEKIELQMPGEKDIDTLEQYYIRIDRVNYDDHDPWPTTPDGDGDSLNRIDASAYGNDSINWLANTPTPGY